MQVRGDVGPNEPKLPLEIFHPRRFQSGPVQVEYPCGVGVSPGEDGADLLLQGILVGKERDDSPPLVAVAEVPVQARPEFPAGIQPPEDAGYLDIEGGCSIPSGGGQHRQDVSHSQFQQVRAQSFYDDFQPPLRGWLGPRPAPFQELRPFRVAKGRGVLYLPPGSQFVRQLELGMPRKIKGGGLEQADAAGGHALQPGNDPRIDKSNAGLITGSSPQGPGIVQIVEDPHPDIGFLGSRLLQGTPQGRFGQKVGEDHAAGQQGNSQENAQQQHHFQLPVSGQPLAGDYVCKVKEGHLKHQCCCGTCTLRPSWPENPVGRAVGSSTPTRVFGNAVPEYRTGSHWGSGREEGAAGGHKILMLLLVPSDSFTITPGIIRSSAVYQRAAAARPNRPPQLRPAQRPRTVQRPSPGLLPVAG